MQIRHQVVQLLLRQLLLKGGHLGAAHENDVGNSVVVGGDSTLHERLFEQPIQAWPAQAMCAVGVMTFGAARIVNPPALRLLRSQPQFGVGLARLGIAAPERS